MRWLVLLGLLGLCSSSTIPIDVRSRYDYKHSFKSPYFVNEIIPHFDTFGSVIKSDDYIRLTPSVRSLQGSVWSNLPLNYDSWEVVMQMMVSGRGKIGGDGLAFWYTSTKLGLGSALGSQKNFDGLMIGFDTYDNDGKRNNPYIFGFLNDGTQEFDPEKDGDAQSFGGCIENFRNTPVHTWVKIRYLDNLLRVDVDTNGRGLKYRTCFEAKVNLPKGYYLGVSAETGGLADDHDLISFEVFELNPPIKTVDPEHPKVEKLSEDEQKRFEHVQEQVQQHKEKKSIEFEMDENYKIFFGEAFGRDEILSFLGAISATQNEILKALEKTIQPSSSPSSPENPQSTQRLNEISQKVNEIQNEIRNRFSGVERTISNIQPNGNNQQGNQVQTQQMTELRQTLEQMMNKINRMEQLQGNIQSSKDDIRMIKESVQRDSGGTDNVTIILGVLVFGLLIAVIILSMKKTKDEKKFV